MKQPRELKFLVFGGSFDPVHLSHLHKAKQTLDITYYDIALIMPAYKHTWGKEMTSPEHRCNIISEALNDFGDRRLKLFPFEIDHQMSGATVETVKLLFSLNADMNKNTTAYLIGMDHANVIDQWTNWEELIKLIPFIVMNRVSVPSLTEWYIKRPHRMVYSDGLAISSTDIRRKLKAGEEVNELTPNTLKYIKEHQLYV